jgi:hypothetical protein
MQNKTSTLLCLLCVVLVSLCLSSLSVQRYYVPQFKAQCVFPSTHGKSPSLLKNCISRGNDPMTNPFAMANLGGVFLVAVDVCIPLLQTEQVAYPLLYLLDRGESNIPFRPSTSYCFVTSDFNFVS